MSLDFSDESYVRLYTRDTKTWLRLGFEGQAVLMFLIRKLDRAGVLDGIEEPVADVALVTGVPVEVVAVGLPRLLEREVFILRGDQLVMPRYVEAQNARQSDRVRKLESRCRRAKGVTIRDPESPAVTNGHIASPTVTPILAQPILAQPILAQPSRASDPERAPEVPGLERVGGVARTYSLPSEQPPKSYLDEAAMAGVHVEQALSTWKHYWGAGLPAHGVEKLHPWLCQRAIERANSLARAPKSSPFVTERWEPEPKALAYKTKHEIDDGNWMRLVAEQRAEDAGGERSLAERHRVFGQRLARHCRAREGKRSA